ncbi:hypothetical protein BX661DRAFT_176162 [Kickxella alabastrina]|uniref:uncharacterized protein n=1 Tax=Kickxella alabastrina TaxID=61397 RepID=UPI0022202A47|nr:uncharacterized protein BX661DRAFT_176162 [Kickxella alabastrina]KAI7835143.1 hypothetical protein BX661DRAFT_176162 [Kickxella alabastrina]KAJ1947546.1 hypothetical protein GGF37_000311 [Kickxella alabastrina]
MKFTAVASLLFIAASSVQAGPIQSAQEGIQTIPNVVPMSPNQIIEKASRAPASPYQIGGVDVLTLVNQVTPVAVEGLRQFKGIFNTVLNTLIVALQGKP